MLAWSQSVAGLPVCLPSVWKFRDESSAHYGKVVCSCMHLCVSVCVVCVAFASTCLWWSLRDLRWRHEISWPTIYLVCESVFVSRLVMSRCLSNVFKTLGSEYVCINVSLSVSITSHMGMHVCRRLGMKRLSYFCACLIFTDSEVVYGPRVSVCGASIFIKGCISLLHVNSNAHKGSIRWPSSPDSVRSDYISVVRMWCRTRAHLHPLLSYS